MFRTIQDFSREWDYEMASTRSVFQHIPNDALRSKENEHIRSIAVLSWHITITLSEMMNKAGLLVSGPDEHSKPPETMEEIIKVYDESAKSVLDQVANHWTNENLLDEINMYGDTWNKGTVLSVLIRHQAHHRGQLTILMRLKGYKVPGVYGPSKEEWSAMGMPSPE